MGQPSDAGADALRASWRPLRDPDCALQSGLASVVPCEPVRPRIDLDLLRQCGVPLTRRPLKAGQHIYRAGQPSHALYFLNAGFAKSTIASADGRHKVTSIHMRGELLGLESFGAATRSEDVVALDDGEMWEIRHADLLAACAHAPALQAGLAAMLAAEIRNERRWMLTRGTLSAEQRVASAMLEFGARSHAAGYSATHFVLRVTRTDMASFLDVNVETAVRAITRLRARGLITVERRDVRLLDVPALCALIAAPAQAHRPAA